MNNNDRKQLSYFPQGLDEAVNNKFGAEVQCKSTYSIFTMSYRTTFAAKGKLKSQIEIYIEGFIAGNKELASRLNTQP